ncbi:ABC transporter ATP-binding protein [Nocardioides daejeonensis]|uniref:ABC transporter ATP-binding protein n=1 Tax=Nocardioides daejeonensis TaxID=1046556 RepID=UPI000D7412C8|nr:ABC transporter ATP-binding protein [Nocardioides daejeonensis]
MSLAETDLPRTGLTVTGLRWSVRDRRILEVPSLTLRPGRVTGLLGPNGSGKTTLLHLVSGVRRPDSGSVRWGEVDLLAMRTRERARLMALVEQHSGTALELTVRQVVELGRVPHRLRAGLPERDVDGPAAVDRAIAATRIEPLVQRPWRQLSGGERQRVHLARALAQEPQLLLLDEPTNHLDLRHQLDFLTRVRDSGITTVAALHDLELAAAYCDDLVVLDEGRVVAAGPVGEVLTDRLVADVYGVLATVAPHPHHPRLHVRVDGVLDTERCSR